MALPPKDLDGRPKNSVQVAQRADKLRRREQARRVVRCEVCGVGLLPGQGVLKHGLVCPGVRLVP